MQDHPTLSIRGLVVRRGARTTIDGLDLSVAASSA
jgi:hypothetical protein